MGPRIGETYLKALRLFKTAWHIQIKIIHIWTQFTPGFGDTLDMIVADEAMHATVKKIFSNRWKGELKLGEWKLFDTFRKILPVIGGGDRPEIVMGALNSSYLWKDCDVLKLTKNMRLFANKLTVSEANKIQEFSDWILAVGDGKIGEL
ncbi:hypothetical protein V5N11_026673 [Cardamine amara subsp. amara]|uniref:ATP-dependent DNA helicase n=1 Tax=Cardamine amara subsp. amara TaxID=228776 RepID=A0ABD1AFC1_CARAN